jgi:hypothetical protein
LHGVQCDDERIAALFSQPTVERDGRECRVRSTLAIQDHPAPWNELHLDPHPGWWRRRYRMS